jgi:hypothetical protein
VGLFQQADKIIGGGQFGDVYLATQEIKVSAFRLKSFVANSLKKNTPTISIRRRARLGT